MRLTLIFVLCLQLTGCTFLYTSDNDIAADNVRTLKGGGDGKLKREMVLLVEVFK